MTNDAFSWLTGRVLSSAGDAELARLSPGLSAVVAVASAGRRFVFALANGMLTRDADDARADLELTIPPEVLARLTEVPPPPRHQGFTALQIANPDVEMRGDALLLAQARPALERVFERALSAPTAAAPARPRDLGRLAGRYVALKTAEGTFDVFTETAGTEGAVPIVFLHTAGADSRQFQAQLADVALCAVHEMHAPDMPFHGRSMPRLDWDGAPYRLDAARYAGWVCAYLQQVVGRPAILAGCSMGAAITLEVAARHPELLAGAIVIEPPFQAKGRINPGQHNVAVHAGLHNGAFVRGLMAPTSPEGYRRRAAWIYSQAAPGVYQADLGFYSLEFDGALTAPRVDAQRLPVALLSGRYDYSATPEDGARLAALMPGANQIVMPELGHFPMTEHPDLFARYLDEALALMTGSGRNVGSGSTPQTQDQRKGP